MSVDVRLLLSSFYHSTSSTLFSIFLVYIYFMKKKVFLISLLKILYKFYNCIRKSFFEATILNQVITTQNYELVLYWKWLKEKTVCQPNIVSYCIDCNRRGVFQGCWCHFSNFLQRGKTIHCLQVHDIYLNNSITEEIKYHSSVVTYLNHYLQQIDLVHLLYKQ